MKIWGSPVGQHTHPIHSWGGGKPMLEFSEINRHWVFVSHQSIFNSPLITHSLSPTHLLIPLNHKVLGLGATSEMICSDLSLSLFLSLSLSLTHTHTHTHTGRLYSRILWKEQQNVGVQGLDSLAKLPGLNLVSTNHCEPCSTYF